MSDRVLPLPRTVPRMNGTIQFPRRSCVDQWTPEEAAIHDLVGQIESLGASLRLTDAVSFLAKAADSLADHLEWVPDTGDGQPFLPVTEEEGRLAMAMCGGRHPHVSSTACNDCRRDAKARLAGPSVSVRDSASANPPGGVVYVMTETDRAEVAELERLRALLNTPEITDFAKGVVLEAAHQRERWDDTKKTDFDWHAVAAYLAAKALLNPAQNDGTEGEPARLHRLVAIGALVANWHAAVLARPTTQTAAAPAGAA